MRLKPPPGKPNDSRPQPRKWQNRDGSWTLCIRAGDNEMVFRSEADLDAWLVDWHKRRSRLSGASLAARVDQVLHPQAKVRTSRKTLHRGAAIKVYGTLKSSDWEQGRIGNWWMSD